MILTFKVKHDRDFSLELGKAKRIAEFVLSHKTRSSKDVKQFGLKSAISNQILRKHGNIRKDLQKKGKLRLVKKIKNRESGIVRDFNHKIAKAIVNIAIVNNSGIKLEQLDGIRNNRKHTRKFNYSPHSWSFCQLQNLIEYKAKLCGIPLTYAEPKNTSKECSRCGNMGIRDSKKVMCQSCGHVDHADANASFNIALRQPINSNIGQLNKDRDLFRGSADTPRGDSL